MDPQKYYFRHPLGGQVFSPSGIFCQLGGQQPRIQHFLRAIQAFDHHSVIDPKDSSTLNRLWQAPPNNLQFSLFAHRQFLQLQRARSGKVNKPHYHFNLLRNKKHLVVCGVCYPKGDILVITKVFYSNAIGVAGHKALLLMLFIVGLVCDMQSNEHIRVIDVKVGRTAEQSDKLQRL